jgi:outer membrane protein OmpA-like peptidoglycan-associated protein
MKRKSSVALTASNAALTILFTGAAIITPAAAQDAAKPTPTSGATLQYTGGDTRFGIGYDSETKLRGELFQVLRSDEKSATLAEIWASRDSGGAKLSHHWSGNTTSVNKVFGAVDQGANSLRKATLGGGQEYEQWFWNTYLSKGLSGARLTGTAVIANTVTQSGIDAGRPFVEDVTTTVTTRSYQRPYDWGVGARVGQFYEGSLVRVTAGLDYEWGKFSSRQWTGTLMAEKFFAGSPISVALSGEVNRRSGDFEGARNDQRGLVMLRYELGAPKSNFRPNKITRSVTSTERVPDPNWKPAVLAAVATPDATAASSAAAKPAEATTRMEKRTTRANSNDAQETYFDLSSSRLKPAAMKELDALALRIAAQQPYVELKVNIVGHTCPTGNDRNNVLLSTKRADAVKAYLVAKGVPTELVTTSGQAGRSPKYPEVKGQSFRNRRADTDVLIVKEKTENVSVTVPAAPATAPATGAVAAPPAAAAAPATAPMIDRQVTRDVIEDVPNNWISRALHNPAQHKTTVDSYRWAEASTAQSTGARRFINRGPSAVNDAYTVDCAAPITFNVLVNDSDKDSDTLTITSVSTPGKGTASISAGRIVYAANATTCGGATDTFIYTISDGKGGTATATVAVTINNTAPPPPTNNIPVAVNDVFIVPCRSTAALDVLLNDSDKDGDALTITAITQPSKSAISIAANGKSLLYTPGASCFVNDTFTYTISDGKGGTATATVTLIDP